MPNLELYGTASCPYTSEMREWLEWKGSEFAEFDVETDVPKGAGMLNWRSRHSPFLCWLKTVRSFRSAGRVAAAW